MSDPVRLVQRGPTTACIGSAGAPETVAIERVDVYGTTVTYPGPEGRSLYGCDVGAVSAADPTEDGPWCGRAFGLLAGGRLRDPRLSLGCRSAEGKPIGFAWIEPAAEAAYVAVSSSGYGAVYPVARGLPVRVGTDDVDLETSITTFDVTEHARRRLALTPLRARGRGLRLTLRHRELEDEGRSGARSRNGHERAAVCLCDRPGERKPQP